jgi:hypothetical protein
MTIRVDSTNIKNIDIFVNKYLTDILTAHDPYKVVYKNIKRLYDKNINIYLSKNCGRPTILTNLFSERLYGDEINRSLGNLNKSVDNNWIELYICFTKIQKRQNPETTLVRMQCISIYENDKDEDEITETMNNQQIQIDDLTNKLSQIVKVVEDQKQIVEDQKQVIDNLSNKTVIDNINDSIKLYKLKLDEISEEMEKLKSNEIIVDKKTKLKMKIKEIKDKILDAELDNIIEYEKYLKRLEDEYEKINDNEYDNLRSYEELNIEKEVFERNIIYLTTLDDKK